MKGDFSRKTFDASRHYGGVLMQQGRVQLDADWNEQLAIQRHRDHTEARDVIGEVGAPKHEAGFLVQPAPDGADLIVFPGRYYVHGRMCELEATLVPATLLSPTELGVDAWQVDGGAFAAGQYVQVAASGLASAVVRVVAASEADRRLSFTTSLAAFQGAEDLSVRRLLTYLTQPDLPEPAYADAQDPPALALPEGSYLVYLDVWPRHVTALEDERIREKALGGPDTATRVRTVWQVKLWPGPEGDGAPLPDDTECGAPIAGFDALTAPSTGRLAARARPGQEPGPCVLPPGAGYLGLENQLYRIEIHQGGSLGTDAVTFKWSRDNGSVVRALSPIAGTTEYTVEDGPDDVLALANGQWVEQADDAIDLNATVRPLFQFQRDAATGAVTLAFPVDDTRHPKLRRWDSADVVEIPWPPVDEGWLAIEKGVEVRFEAGLYRTGDYWLVPARTVQGDVEWPRDAAGEPIARERLGIDHRYARLGVLSVGGDGALAVEDCRTLFPPLNELKAPYSCCTFTVGDGKVHVGDFTLIQEAVDHLPPEGGQICIFPGTYVENVVIDGRHDVHIKGCGARTRVVSRPPDVEGVAAAVFHLVATANVRLESMAVEAAESAPGVLADGETPNAGVTLDRLSVAASGASAIRIRASHDVTIEGCRVRMTDGNGGAAGIHLQAEGALLRENEVEGTIAGISLEEALAVPGARAVSGIQLAGGCERVRVLDNLVQGLSGQGLTLGSLITVDANGDPTDPGDGDGGEDDPCDACDEPSTGDDTPDDGTDGRPRRVSEGALEGIEVRRNRILECGLDGIGVVRFFDLRQPGKRAASVAVHDLVICENRIERCVRRTFAPIPPSMLDLRAYGGIALALVAGLVLRDNRIEDVGAGGMLPVCGVFVLYVEGLEASRNHVLVASSLPAAEGRAGRRGGIHVVFAVALRAITDLSSDEDEGGKARNRRIRVAAPAAVVEGNTVDVVRGQALAVGAMGPVSVVANRLVSRGSVPFELASLVGSGGPLNVLSHMSSLVAIVNLGASADGPLNVESSVSKGPSLAAGPSSAFARKVMFDDNQCLLDVKSEPKGTSGAAGTGGLLPPAILVLSYDDISFADNQCDCRLAGGRMLFATLLLSLFSVRAVSNRFSETLGTVGFSAVTLAGMNMTVNNQANHCLWIVGPLRQQALPNHIFITLLPAFKNYCPNAGHALAGAMRAFSQKEATADEDELMAALPGAASRVDALHAAVLDGLDVVTEARGASLAREQRRLARKLGADHERVRRVAADVEDAAARRLDLAGERTRARTAVPRVAESEWAVHGYVMRDRGTPAADVAVSLVDARGAWLRALGFANTDVRGYFKLVAKVEAASDGSVPILTGALRVTDADRKEVYRGRDPLAVVPGVIEYREIVVDGRRPGGPPEGEEPAPPRPPRPERPKAARPTPAAPPRKGRKP